MNSLSGYSIEETPRTQIKICTTGITKTELGLLELPKHIKLMETLYPTTNVLVTYKCIFTEKYIQALRWNIPIVSVKYLYNLNDDYQKYCLKPLDGAIFSTSGVSDRKYVNYCCLLGGHYEANASVFIDFLISESKTSEKYLFCLKHGIPVVSPESIFLDDYSLFSRYTKYDAKCSAGPEMYSGYTFYIDPEMPVRLFNVLKRIVVEHGGTRVSCLTEEIDHIFTLCPEKYCSYTERLYHYQYLLDCSEIGANLYSEFYRIHNTYRKDSAGFNEATNEKIKISTHQGMSLWHEKAKILSDTVAAIDRNLGGMVLVLTNKLRSLGAVVRKVPDMRTTHYITEKSIGEIEVNTKRKKISYVRITPGWIDECLQRLVYVKEDKYLLDGRRIFERRKTLLQHPHVLFQFTGMSEEQKRRAMDAMKKINIEYVDSQYYQGGTHLIMEKMGLSEKFFSSLLNGCWILRPEFIEKLENISESIKYDEDLTKDSQVSNYNAENTTKSLQEINYEDYEWIPEKNTSAKDLRPIASIRNWRKRIGDGEKLPFIGWNVLFYAESSKKERYIRIIENGGGVSTPSMSYTHVFYEKSRKGDVVEKKSYPVDVLFSYIFKSKEDT